MGDDGRNDQLAGPGASAREREVGVKGFVALWRGERPNIADLTDDPATVEALVRAGRLELDGDGILMGVHGLVAHPTAHRIGR